MTRKDLFAAVAAFAIAACATGVADPLLNEPVPEPQPDAGTSDGGGDSDGGGTDGGGIDGGAGGDALPVDALLFSFATACPTGYEAFDAADGRFVLGSATNVLGTSPTAPLAHVAEPGVHTHRVLGSINTPNVDFIAISVTNNGYTNGDDPNVDVQSGPSALGLAYIELLACRKVAEPHPSATLPSGTILPFASATCPSGFTEYSDANGRFVAGLHAGGTNELAVGGAPMTGDSFSHAHEFGGVLAAGMRDPGNNEGCCANNYLRGGDHPFTIPLQSTSVTLPFVRVLYCEKM